MLGAERDLDLLRAAPNTQVVGGGKASGRTTSGGAGLPRTSISGEWHFRGMTREVNVNGQWCHN